MVYRKIAENIENQLKSNSNKKLVLEGGLTTWNESGHTGVSG